MEKNEPTMESLRQGLEIIKEKILKLEAELRKLRSTARTVKKLLERWNQQETDL